MQEEVTYATEEVERLTKVLDEQNTLLQASQEQVAKKDIMIQNLQQKVISFYCAKLMKAMTYLKKNQRMASNASMFAF